MVIVEGMGEKVIGGCDGGENLQQWRNTDDAWRKTLRKRQDERPSLDYGKRNGTDEPWIAIMTQSSSRKIRPPGPIRSCSPHKSREKGAGTSYKTIETRRHTVFGVVRERDGVRGGVEV